MSLIQYLVLGSLAAVWMWVLGRPALMNLLNVSRRDPVGHFNKKMSVLAEAPQRSLAQTGRPVVRPTGPVGGGYGATPSLSANHHRRIQIFLALVISSVVSLVLAVALRGIWVWEFGLMALLLGGYTLLAARIGAAQVERRDKVTYLNPSRNTRSPVFIQAVNER